MTTSEGSPACDFSLSRRSLLLGGVGVASTAALATLGPVGTAIAAQPTGSAPTAAIDFDLDTGNFIRDFRSTDANAGNSSSTDFVAPMDVTILMRIQNLLHLSWFDALAPYHPTAVGVYSRFGRRPASESATNRNMNIAGLHASYQATKSLLPERLPATRALLTAIGLDPDDESEDPTTPVGIGNLAGKAVVAAGERDGMNQLGDLGRTYNGRPYEDYTGYRPVNTAFRLVNPSRWQPQLTPHNRRLAGGLGDKGTADGRRIGGAVGDKGIFTVQQFVTPQLRLVTPRTYRHPSQFRLGPPRHSDHTRVAEYKRSVDEILAISAGLTDRQKVTAEFFDNKLLGIGLSIFAAGNGHDLDMHGWAHLFLMHTTAMFDALIAVWHLKTKYDAVRPFSAIHHVYGSTPVTAWGGPGVGRVDDLPADEWASYLGVGDHPEYPSGSTTLCSAEAQATRRFLGDDVLNWTQPIRAGWTQVEPGITPAADLELRWPTWTDFVQDCAISRVWGGVHFRKTVETSIGFGEQFGDRAYEWVQRYVDGDVPN
jgi:hypothetical protein